MKKRLLSLFLIFMLLTLSSTLFGCSQEPDPGYSEVGPGDSAADTSADITQETVAPGSSQAFLDLPEGALDDGLAVIVEDLSLDTYPEMINGDFFIMGSPVSIKVEGYETFMLNDKAVIDIPVAPGLLSDIENQDDLYVGYFNGESWDYFLPDEVFLEEGMIRFSTYHFSWFGTGKLSEEKQIERFAKQMAVHSWAQKTDEETMIQALEGSFREAFNNMGIASDSAQGKLIRSIVKENDIGSLVVSMESKNLVDFQSKVAEMAGKAVLSYYQLDPTILGNAVNVTSTASKALGFLAANDYVGAQKEIASGMMDFFPAGKAMKAAVEAIDTGINNWKTYEIESAYEAYKNGAAKEKGYDVTPGNFEELLPQMKGVIQRIHTDAISEYCTINGTHRDSLSESEINQIKRNAEAKLKKQFETRKASEAEIAKALPEHQHFIDLLKKGGLLERGYFKFKRQTEENAGTIEDRLRSLYAIKHSLEELVDEEYMTPEQWVELIGIWLQDDTPGRQKVHEAVKQYQSLPAITTGGSTGGDYKWVQAGTIVNDYQSELEQANAGASWTGTISFGGNSASFKVSSNVDSSWLKKGMSHSGTVTWTDPPSVIEPDKEFELTLTAKHDGRDHNNFAGVGSVTAHVVSLDEKNNVINAMPLTTEDGVSLFASTSSNGYETQEGKVLGVLGEGSQYSRMGIQISASNGGVAVRKIYVFEYKAQ